MIKIMNIDISLNLLRARIVREMKYPLSSRKFKQSDKSFFNKPLKILQLYTSKNINKKSNDKNSK